MLDFFFAVGCSLLESAWFKQESLDSSMPLQISGISKDIYCFHKYKGNFDNFMFPNRITEEFGFLWIYTKMLFTWKQHFLLYAQDYSLFVAKKLITVLFTMKF